MNLTTLSIIISIAGITITACIAVMPQLMEWYYENTGRVFSVKVVSKIIKFSRFTEGNVRITIKNRIRSTVAIQIMYGGKGLDQFLDVKLSQYPSHEEGSHFDIYGHDKKQVEIRLKPLQMGKVNLEISVVSNRFKPYQKDLPPCPIEIT
jgi:hypothetical protein